MSVRERIRKIDVDKMTIAQADKLSQDLSNEVIKIMNEAKAKCNEILNIYGMELALKCGFKELAKKEE